MSCWRGESLCFCPHCYIFHPHVPSLVKWSQHLGVKKGKDMEQKWHFLALNLKKKKFGQSVWFRGDHIWHHGSRVLPHLRLSLF